MRDKVPPSTPAYQFTIPSLADGLLLECRIYHPRNFILQYHDDTRPSSRGRSNASGDEPPNPQQRETDAAGLSSEQQRQRHDSSKNEALPTEQADVSSTTTKKGAIIAHPYAPLGGCFDEPVVMAVVEQLLDMGLIVGTFNFRFVTSNTPIFRPINPRLTTNFKTQKEVQPGPKAAPPGPAKQRSRTTFPLRRVWFPICTIYTSTPRTKAILLVRIHPQTTRYRSSSAATPTDP